MVAADVGRVELCVELVEPSAVGGERGGIEDVAGVGLIELGAGMAGDGVGEREGFDVDAWSLDEIAQVVQPFEVGERRTWRPRRRPTSGRCRRGEA